MEGYVHPPHRSLHGPLFVLAIFSIMFGSWSIFFSAPDPVQAVQMQADVQCPAGGVVGQKCFDNTNGYTTTGHCTHIMVCAADNWPKAPRGCQPGQVTGQDCPYGKGMPGMPTQPQPFPISTSSYTPIPFDSGIGNSEFFNSAYSDQNPSDSQPSRPQTVVGTSSIEGIMYLITDDNEQLKVGEPLSSPPDPEPTKLGPREMNLGPTYMLNPGSKNPQNSQASGETTRGYASGGSFAGAPRTSGDTGSSQDIPPQGGSFIGGIMNSLAMLFAHQRPADELVVVAVAVPAMVIPDVSLYYQSQHLTTPGYIDIGWDSLSASERALGVKGPTAGQLARSALSHTGRAALELLTADLSAARRDLAQAASDGGAAVRSASRVLAGALGKLF